MTNINGKTVKLTDKTLKMIELYRLYVSDNTEDQNLKMYVLEMSYDKIIQNCFFNKLLDSNVKLDSLL